jgi:hypothetical protein
MKRIAIIALSAVVGVCIQTELASAQASNPRARAVERLKQSTEDKQRTQATAPASTAGQAQQPSGPRSAMPSVRQGQPTVRSTPSVVETRTRMAERARGGDPSAQRMAESVPARSDVMRSVPATRSAPQAVRRDEIPARSTSSIAETRMRMIERAASGDTKRRPIGPTSSDGPTEVRPGTMMTRSVSPTFLREVPLSRAPSSVAQTRARLIERARGEESGAAPSTSSTSTLSDRGSSARPSAPAVRVVSPAGGSNRSDVAETRSRLIERAKMAASRDDFAPVSTFLPGSGAVAPASAANPRMQAVERALATQRERVGTTPVTPMPRATSAGEVSFEKHAFRDDWRHHRDQDGHDWGGVARTRISFGLFIGGGTAFHLSYSNRWWCEPVWVPHFYRWRDCYYFWRPRYSCVPEWYWWDCRPRLTVVVGSSSCYRPKWHRTCCYDITYSAYHSPWCVSTLLTTHVPAYVQAPVTYGTIGAVQTYTNDTGGSFVSPAPSPVVVTYRASASGGVMDWADTPARIMASVTNASESERARVAARYLGRSIAGAWELVFEKAESAGNRTMLICSARGVSNVPSPLVALLVDEVPGNLREGAVLTVSGRLVEITMGDSGTPEGLLVLDEVRVAM